MPGKDMIENSLSYRSASALFRYFFTSASFTAVKGISRSISGTFGMVFLHSKSRELFLSFFKRCAENIRPILSASISAVLFCHLSLNILIGGAVNYAPTFILVILLGIAYFIFKGSSGKI